MSEDDRLYDGDRPEGHSSSLVTVLAVGAGILFGLAVDYLVWMAWLAQSKRRHQ